MIPDEEYRQLYEQVRSTHLKPPVTLERIVREGKTQTAAFWWVSRTVTIDERFVEGLLAHAQKEELIRGLFTHELSHYMYHPRTLEMNLYLSFQARRFFNDPAKSEGYNDAKTGRIYHLFTDFFDNILTVRQDLHGRELMSLLAAQYLQGKDAVDRSATAVWLAYTRRMEGFPVTVETQDAKVIEAAAKLEELEVIPANNHLLQRAYLWTFGEAIKDLVDDDLQRTIKNSLCGGAGEPGDGQGAPIYITPDDVKDMPPALHEEVEKAIRRMILKLSKQEYETFRKEYLGEKKGEHMNSLPPGLGSCGVQTPDAQTIAYYKDVIRQHGYYITPRRVPTVASRDLTGRIQEFAPNDPPGLLDLRYSGGKILPGLTKRRANVTVPSLGTKETLPVLFLQKDVSGSMDNPMMTRCPVTTAAGIIAMSYCRSGSPVLVSLFDGESTQPVGSRDIDEVLFHLCSYRGGGTSLDLEQLRKDLDLPPDYVPTEDHRHNPRLQQYLRKHARITVMPDTKVPVDLVLITDGGIMNIGEVVGFLRENPEIRPTIIHTGGYNMGIAGYDGQTTGTYEGIMIYRAKTDEDLITMAKKTARKNLVGK